MEFCTVTLLDDATLRPPQLFQLAWIASIRTFLLVVMVAPLVFIQLAACSKTRPRRTRFERPTTLMVLERTAASIVALEGSVPLGGKTCNVPLAVFAKKVPGLRSE